MNVNDADSIKDLERYCINDIDSVNETDSTYDINHQQIESMISSIATTILLASMNINTTDNNIISSIAMIVITSH